MKRLVKKALAALLAAAEHDEVSGGTMRGNVVIRDTTDISQDTKKNI